MPKNQKLLTVDDEQEENKKEVRRPVFLIDKKERRNIKDYIFNDLKITDTKWNKNLLDEDEEKKLFKKYIKTGNKAAFDKIIVSNLRFVIYMAKHFYSGLKTQYNCRDIYLDDLIQAWNIWLIKAAEKYVPKKGCRFLSYAQHVIKSSFIHYIKYENRFFWATSVYGVPDSKVKQMNKYVENFLQENKREPEDEELQNFYRDYEDSLEDFSANVWYYRHLTDGVVSLDMNLQELSRKEDKLTDKIRWWIYDLFASDDEKSRMKDLLVDLERESKQPMEGESLACDIDRILRKLDDRKREILKMYYWLGWYKKIDIEDIAYTFWVMIPAIRQQRLRALEIIREEIIPNLLKKYL